MAFKIEYMRAGKTPAYEQRAVSAGITAEAGTLLVFGSDGNLAVCGASADPQFLLNEDVAATTAGQLVSVQPISREAVYSAPASVSMASVKTGSAVNTLNGVSVTATATTSGSGATVLAYPEGTDSDAPVLVEFTGKTTAAASGD